MLWGRRERASGQSGFPPAAGPLALHRLRQRSPRRAGFGAAGEEFGKREYSPSTTLRIRILFGCGRAGDVVRDERRRASRHAARKGVSRLRHWGKADPSSGIPPFGFAQDADGARVASGKEGRADTRVRPYRGLGGADTLVADPDEGWVRAPCGHRRGRRVEPLRRKAASSRRTPKGDAALPVQPG